MIVTLAHFRTIPGNKAKPGYCAPAGRVWFERFGLSWRDFVMDGIDADLLRATGDALGIALVEWAEHCEAKTNEVTDGRQ